MSDRLRETDNALTPELLLRAYAYGVFPMAESRDSDELYWIDPQLRGILPIDDFHVPKRLKRTIRQGKFEVRIDCAFEEVIDGCAEAREGRENTWINEPIRRLYTALFDMGFAHSVETWRDGRLVGGLYGVAIGGAYFGESMFSRERDASKVALVYLTARLKRGRYTLVDTQFVTDHLKRFGAHEIPRGTYHVRLQEALRQPATFYPEPWGFRPGSPDEVLATIAADRRTLP